MTHDTHPTPTTHTHTHTPPQIWGDVKKTSKKTAPDGTNKHTDILTDGHGDSMTESAQWADSVKTK